MNHLINHFHVVESFLSAKANLVVRLSKKKFQILNCQEIKVEDAYNNQ